MFVKAKTSVTGASEVSSAEIVTILPVSVSASAITGAGVSYSTEIRSVEDAVEEAVISEVNALLSFT